MWVTLAIVASSFCMCRSLAGGFYQQYDLELVLVLVESTSDFLG